MQFNKLKRGLSLLLLLQNWKQRKRQEQQNGIANFGLQKKEEKSFKSQGLA
jgi:hypothetical protein